MIVKILLQKRHMYIIESKEFIMSKRPIDTYMLEKVQVLKNLDVLMTFVTMSSRQ